VSERSATPRRRLTLTASLFAAGRSAAEADDMLWSRRQKRSWYGEHFTDWLSKETVCALCTDLGVPLRRKVPCTKVVVTKSKQQLMSTLERLADGDAYAWVNKDVQTDTLRAACNDLGISQAGDAGALRNRLRAIFAAPQVFLQRMCGAQDEGASLGADTDEAECGESAASKDTKGKVSCGTREMSAVRPSPADISRSRPSLLNILELVYERAYFRYTLCPDAIHRRRELRTCQALLRLKFVPRCCCG